MKELGEYLKETRIDHGVSLEEAAEDLQMSESQLENMESGNVRAFQDVYTLKEYVRNYAKYLGLDSDKVLDEFNDFLFEHTSKISLSDILEEEAKRKAKEKEEPKKKISSPYTKIKATRPNVPLAPIVLVCLILLLLVLIIYLLLKNASDARKIDTELQPARNSWEEKYEFTY